MEIEMSSIKVFWKLLMISWPNLLELKQSPNRKKSASMHSIISDCLTLCATYWRTTARDTMTWEEDGETKTAYVKGRTLVVSNGEVWKLSCDI